MPVRPRPTTAEVKEKVSNITKDKIKALLKEIAKRRRAARDPTKKKKKVYGPDGLKLILVIEKLGIRNFDIGTSLRDTKVKINLV